MSTCPYCRQERLDEGDARLSCTCYHARKYRKTLDALKSASEDAAPMKEIDGELMEKMKELAHYICALKLSSAQLALADGTVVKIGTKVSRTARLKVEEKVDE